jgi:radical SAM-linked protein
MDPIPTYRYRMRFAKKVEMRYTSHLDLLRAWERTFRRARLPLTYSQGYHPRAKINIGLALPLGFTSECELLDFWLEEDLEEAEIITPLSETLPPGLEILSLDPITEREAGLQQRIVAAEYLANIGPSSRAAELNQVVEYLLSSDHLTRTRRGKSYDLRPLIEAIELSTDNGTAQLDMRLTARQGATGRPDEVLRALGLDPLTIHIHRKRLILSD